MRARGVILLEGCDGTGKTTLARALVREHDGVYIHNRYHRDVWPFFMATLRWAQRASQDRLVVVDRHWVSECVYARVYRGGSAHPWDVRALARVWARLGALNVLCLPPVKAVIENHKRLKGERSEMYENVEHVAARYQRLWDGQGAWTVGADYVEQLSEAGVKHRYDWARYDFTACPDDRTFTAARWTLLARLATLRRYDAWDEGLLSFQGELSGNVNRAQVLLVGDRSNRERPSWPFCHNKGSSTFLNKTLHILRVDEAAVAMANVNDATRTAAGAARLLAACERVGHVIALGGEASVKLQVMGVEHDRVRHPQHASRFTHHGGSYAAELKAALDRCSFAAYL